MIVTLEEELELFAVRLASWAEYYNMKDSHVATDILDASSSLHQAATSVREFKERTVPG